MNFIAALNFFLQFLDVQWMFQFHDFPEQNKWWQEKKHILFRLIYFSILFFVSTISAASRRTPAGMTMDLFEQHQGTHILQVKKIIQLKFLKIFYPFWWDKTEILCL